MSSLKKRIEDAVIAILNAGDFSSEFEAVRGPRSLKKLEQTTDLQVIVVAEPMKRGRLSRNGIEWTWSVAVGFFHKVGYGADEEISTEGLEAVQLVAEEVAEALDVILNIEGSTSNSAMTPEIDYEPDDGFFWSKGIATVQVDAKYTCWVPRRS